jgi:hypothetical protein
MKIVKVYNTKNLRTQRKVTPASMDTIVNLTHEDVKKFFSGFQPDDYTEISLTLTANNGDEYGYDDTDY